MKVLTLTVLQLLCTSAMVRGDAAFRTIAAANKIREQNPVHCPGKGIPTEMVRNATLAMCS